MEADKQLAGEVALRFLSGPLAEKTIAVQQQAIMIGRDRQNDVVVLDPGVSRQHARIRRQLDTWTIENLSQSSFIAIDQQRTSQGVLPRNFPRDAPPSSTMVAPLSESGKPSLVVSSNIHGEVTAYPLDSRVVNIGRDPHNDRAISFVPIILIPQVIFSGAIIPLKDWLTQILATVFPTRWAMAALDSSIGLHADTVGGDRLFDSAYTYHSTLFSIYSQDDAVHRLLTSWLALGIIIVALMVVIGMFLKRKDARG